eukprot:m.190369 g.190369  ORF g.190369 m.190369 type:complete len:74 (+) comp14816_c0_seq2:862-1083(+)
MMLLVAWYYCLTCTACSTDGSTVILLPNGMSIERSVDGTRYIRNPSTGDVLRETTDGVTVCCCACAFEHSVSL